MMNLIDLKIFTRRKKIYMRKKTKIYKLKGKRLMNNFVIKN